MEQEDKIIGMLESITGRIDGIDNRLDGMDKRMDSFEQKLDMQGETLKEHGQILSALQSGQEYIKTGIGSMKGSDEKEFNSLKEMQDDHSAKLELLREETWANRVDIRRIENTIGVK